MQEKKEREWERREREKEINQTRWNQTTHDDSLPCRWGWSNESSLPTAPSRMKLPHDTCTSCSQYRPVTSSYPTPTIPHHHADNGRVITGNDNEYRCLLFPQSLPGVTQNSVPNHSCLLEKTVFVHVLSWNIPRTAILQYRRLYEVYIIFKLYYVNFVSILSSYILLKIFFFTTDCFVCLAFRTRIKHSMKKTFRV